MITKDAGENVSLLIRSTPCAGAKERVDRSAGTNAIRDVNMGIARQTWGGITRRIAEGIVNNESTTGVGSKRVRVVYR